MAARQDEATGASGKQTFYSALAERFDRWRTLNRIARSWAAAEAGGGERRQSTADLRSIGSDLLAQMETLESFFAYPGPKLMAAVRERIAGGDAAGLVRLVQRISSALLTRSYREDPGAAEVVDEAEPTGLAPTTASADGARRTSRISRCCSWGRDRPRAGPKCGRTSGGYGGRRTSSYTSRSWSALSRMRSWRSWPIRTSKPSSPMTAFRTNLSTRCRCCASISPASWVRATFRRATTERCWRASPRDSGQSSISTF